MQNITIWKWTTTKIKIKKWSRVNLMFGARTRSYHKPCSFLHLYPHIQPFILTLYNTYNYNLTDGISVDHNSMQTNFVNVFLLPSEQCKDVSVWWSLSECVISTFIFFNRLSVQIVNMKYWWKKMHAFQCEVQSGRTKEEKEKKEKNAGHTVTEPQRNECHVARQMCENIRNVLYHVYHV